MAAPTSTDRSFDEFDEFDEMNDPRPQTSQFTSVVARAMSRRAFLGRGAALGAVAFVPATGILTSPDARAAGRFGFKPVAANSLDTITVPDGYSWHRVVAWGDPLWSDSADFDEDTTGTGATQERQFGDNNDGMSLFTNGNRHILVVNNEYTNRSIMYHARDSKSPETADDVRKGKAAHGVSIVEIAQRANGWGIVKDSTYNRRITADTPMRIVGPAAGHELLRTAADPSGTRTLGTWNNCGNGRTPWGTYLACEENFNGYFSSSDTAYKPTAEMSRYGVRVQDIGYAWAAADERFDISKHPNEPNRAGYIVEIDPFDPTATPRKLTALGRFKHENAEVVIARNGHIVVYLGDDEPGEYLYKFVSKGTYSVGGDNSELLTEGALSVARFDDNMSGEWIELTPASTGLKNAAEIRIHTRQAASAVGATTMDRPEWVAANPRKVEAYCCLTKNKYRGMKPNAGGDATPVGGPNPREANNYGQIVRWAPHNGDHTANGFEWDLYVIAGNPTVHSDANAGSTNVTAENTFNSPDGLAFDSTGMLWIQTDGNYSNKGNFANQGNNQMLIGDPQSGEIRRFMVGPKECEITGITWSPDRRTVFVGIQHPGERGNSHFPGGGNSLPRSAVVAIQRDDGGLIG